MENRITDIHCLQCGAPAAFDIVRQRYLCGYCGGTVEISEAKQEKQGFRDLQREKLRDSVKKFRLNRTSCSGSRSKSAVGALRKMGYADAKSIGGILAYKGELER